MANSNFLPPISDCPPYMEIWVHTWPYTEENLYELLRSIIVHGLPPATNSTSEKGGTEEGGYCILNL
jgi:hypothetical protein